MKYRIASRRERGQSLVELGMILILVAVVLFVFFAVIGRKANQPVANMANQIGDIGP